MIREFREKNSLRWKKLIHLFVLTYGIGEGLPIDIIVEVFRVISILMVRFAVVRYTVELNTLRRLRNIDNRIKIFETSEKFNFD